MSAFDTAATVISNILLFFLVMGMSSTVDIRDLKSQLRNWKAIGTGLFCQFILLPFIGFIVVKMFKLPVSVGVTLLVIVSSPGGSYSNWWCSLMNADLALSVTMTAMSTILCVAFLPANLLLYTNAAYSDYQGSDGQSIVKSLNFGALFISIGVVIGAIVLGMVASAKFDNPRFHKMAYIFANVSGILLILFSVILSFVGGGDDSDNSNMGDVKGQTARFYFSTGLPVLFGIVGASILATLCRLPKPERLTTAVECCYQNTGIAQTAAISLFTGEDLQDASRVTLLYGIVEIVVIALYLIIFWKLGWSKAPKNERICKVITKNYNVVPHEEEEGDVPDSKGNEEEAEDKLEQKSEKESSTLDNEEETESELEQKSKKEACALVNEEETEADIEQKSKKEASTLVNQEEGAGSSPEAQRKIADSKQRSTANGSSSFVVEIGDEFRDE